MLKKLKEQRQVWIPIVVILFLFALKYGYTYFKFRYLPVGYDAGIYHYLFIRFADGLPPFSIPDLPPWTKAHALGLFFFTSIFIHLGIPATWFVGFLWNYFNVLLPFALSFVIAKRNGRSIGILVLFVSLLSVVQYEAFLLIYWKTMFALFWCTLAFGAYERKSWLLVPYGMLTIASHQQIGAIFVASISGALSVRFFVDGIRLNVRSAAFAFLAILLGCLWYLPNYDLAVAAVFHNFLTIDAAVAFGILGLIVLCVMAACIAAPKHRSIMMLLITGIFAVPMLFLPMTGIAPDILRHFLQGNVAMNPGVFLSLSEYVSTSFPLLLLGIIGFVHSFRRERGSVWQSAVIVSACMVCSLLFFYRRFILPLDFFLLPFAALGLQVLWQYRAPATRIVLTVLIVIQSYFLIHRMQRVDPGVDLQDLVALWRVDDIVSPNSVIVSLDTLAPWVLGIVTDAYVVGPGIFDSQPYEAWQKFFYGTDDDRALFMDHYPTGTYFYASRFFREYYPLDVQTTITTHRCFAPEDAKGLYRSICGKH